MPVFAYTAVDAKGQEVKSEVEAVSPDEAVSKIRGMGYFPTLVKAKEKRVSAEAVQKRHKAAAIGGVSKKQLTIFTRQMAILINAGLPVVRSIRILEGQQKPGVLKNALMDVGDDVEGGSSLSEAMSKHPKVFDKLYVNMVKAGEAGGVLDTILERLADFREKTQRLKKQIISAMLYPSFVISAAIIILIIIMIVVVPQFKKMFLELGIELPVATKILLGTATMLLNHWYLIVFVPIGIFVMIKLIGLNKSGRYAIDLIKLKLPLFGMIISKATVSRFARTLGTLITSGVPILEALNIVQDASGNAVMARAIARVHGSIREGENIAQPLGQSGVVDDMVVNMIDVGEETGELDKMLLKVADVYDDDVDAAVAGMMSLLEPMLIIGLGAVVGFIVIALYMPLIKIMSSM
jgi:type IV pilus assembly protein PilC